LTNLTAKQRAKINAALCIIHDNDGDAQAVTALAHTIMATGHDARSSYEKALTSFAAENPELGAAIGKMTRLVEASSVSTVAAYDSALSDYIATGNNAGMLALAPMIAKDSIALAIVNGEMTEADVATGGLAQALGFEPSLILQQAHTANTAPAAPVAEANPAIGLGDVPANGSSSSDQYVSMAPMGGHVTPKTQAAWARDGHVGCAPTTGPATISLPAQSGMVLPDAA